MYRAKYGIASRLLLTLSLRFLNKEDLVLQSSLFYILENVVVRKKNKGEGL